MPEREGVLQVLDNFAFGLQFSGAIRVLLEGLHVDRLARERTEKEVIGEAEVLHLFGECAHALELAVGRREGILVFGHSFGGGNHLLLDNAVKRVEDGRDGGRLLRR